MEGEGQHNLICDRTPPSHIPITFPVGVITLRLSPTGELTGDLMLIL
jgi:hypothetical protein